LDRTLTKGSHLRRSQFPADFSGTIGQRSWRGIVVDMNSETNHETDGDTTIAYIVPIPLRPKAIRLLVTESGPTVNGEDLSRLLDQLLSSLEGETNW
jgi:hypothetical protein